MLSLEIRDVSNIETEYYLMFAYNCWRHGTYHGTQTLTIISGFEIVRFCSLRYIREK
jgi:hypothetical protein